MAQKPYHLIVGPVEIWFAPAGTAFPLINGAPSGSFTKVGTDGSKDYSEDGVTCSHPQTMEVFRGLGSTGPRKIFRTEEDLMIALLSHDISLEQYALALNQNTVTTTAPASGIAGIKEIPLHRGAEVAQIALLVRGVGKSPYDPSGGTFNIQYQVPIVSQVGEPEVVFEKGVPAGLELEFQAIEDPDAAAGEEFGKLVAQNAAALP